MSEIIQENEERVYKAYRNALRSFRASANGSTCRAADRRNRARKAVVERYNVSFQDVKRIVAKFDAVNNITHPDDPSYVLRRKLEVARAEYAHNPVSHCPKCDGDDMVTLRANMVDWGKGTFTPVVSCYLCYRNIQNQVI